MYPDILRDTTYLPAQERARPRLPLPELHRRHRHECGQAARYPTMQEPVHQRSQLQDFQLVPGLRQA